MQNPSPPVRHVDVKDNQPPRPQSRRNRRPTAYEITMTIDGVDHPLQPEGCYQIPGGVEHSATAGPEGCRVLDLFHPVREDYVARAGG